MNNRTNNILFFVSMAVILFGYTWLTQPSQEEIARMQAERDSIAMVEKARVEAEAAAHGTETQDVLTSAVSDSLRQALLSQDFGEFAAAMNGGAGETATLENELVKVDFSTRGGFVQAATLKKFNQYDGQSVVLNDSKYSTFNIELPTATKKNVNTKDLNFAVSAKSDTSITLTATTAAGGMLSYTYTLPADEYMLSMQIQSRGLNLKQADAITIDWKQDLYQREKGRKFENRYTTVYYKEYEDDVEYLSETSNDAFTADDDEPIKWVAFKDQFFSSFLISDDKFIGAKLASTLPTDQADTAQYLKRFTASLTVPFATDKDSKADFHLYFGPNKYSILYDYDDKLGADVDMNRILTLGWGIFRWVNQALIIPLFNLFGSFLSNYGLIIFLMTLVIKMLIFPLTYKSFLSTAKMRVLKPQIDEINSKIPEENAMERQQAMMQMYQKAGVNPMGGCLPMLLQMPILFAMFSFFPASIELRGQSFLWADDLSSYDAIVSWNTHIPLLSDTFGNHISLFCLLMTVTNVAYTYLNMKLTDTGATQQPKMMKYMMYFMPIMFMFIFNDYASGLSYYYFISLIITIIQTYVIRKTVDEKKLLAKLKENARKPQSKSSWMSRLEEMQRMQQEQMKKQQGK